MSKDVDRNERPQAYDRDNRSLMEEEARVRSKFANERTFAAWTRTALTLVVAGLAVGQFLARGPAYEIHFLLLGGGFVLAGVVLFWYAAVEYLRSRKQMKMARFHAPRKSLVGISVVLSLLSLALLAVIALGIFGGA